MQKGESANRSGRSEDRTGWTGEVVIVARLHGIEWERDIAHNPEEGLLCVESDSQPTSPLDPALAILISLLVLSGKSTSS